jgi:hypothetical protein
MAKFIASAIEQAYMVSETPPERRYELEKIADKDHWPVYVMGVFLSPIAYVMLGKNMRALLNLVTLNWFLTGIVTVPIHCIMVFNKVEDELGWDEFRKEDEADGIGVEATTTGYPL